MRKTRSRHRHAQEILSASSVISTFCFRLLPLPAATMPLLSSGSLCVAAALLVFIAAIGGAIWMRKYGRQTQALRASEERFRQLFENAVEGVYETLPDGGFRAVNPAMARILGYATAAEVLELSAARTAEIYVTPQRRAEFFAQLGTGNEVANFESEIRRADGTTAWIKENVRAVRDANGRLLYLQGFVSDVTARQKTEDALRASEERYRVLFEHLPIAIVEHDYRPVAAWLDHLRANGIGDLEAWLDAHPQEWRAANAKVTFVGANAATLRLYGVKTLGEAVANLDRIFTPEAYAGRRQVFLAMWRGLTESDGDSMLRSMDGRLRQIFYHWRVPTLDGQPQFQRSQLALIDVTEIKSAQQALAAERERLSVTLRAMSEAVITFSRTAQVQFMNEAAAELTGWTAAAAIGQPFYDVCRLETERGGQQFAVSALGAASIDRPVDLPPHSMLRTRNGTSRRVEGRCAPMHDVSGEVVGVVLVLRDVTQRSRLETELLRASKLESIGVLAGGIAHDFNNLLAIVMGNLTMALLDEPTRTAGEKWLREAERGTLRAKDLTLQLLTFAKGGNPVRAAVLLPDVVREAAEFALHGSAVRCEFDLAADLRPAEVDKGQIGQVVQNLVINAVQAMRAGGTIRLTLRNEQLAAGALGTLAAGDYLRLEVADTGCGISPEHLTRIFEPFFTTKEAGTGLGLATVYSVIQKHQGHVTVESALGHGTTFRIWLPAAQGQPVRPSPPSSAFQQLQGRVLFMDDEEPIRVVTKALLDRLGLEATLTCDGQEAVREFANAHQAGRPYDVVIVDLTVPGAMGGADAMREILKIDPLARGIVSSGYSSDPVMANFRAHGFRGFVPKPYKIADFARTLREVLDGA